MIDIRLSYSRIKLKGCFNTAVAFRDGVEIASITVRRSQAPIIGICVKMLEDGVSSDETVIVTDASDGHTIFSEATVGAWAAASVGVKKKSPKSDGDGDEDQPEDGDDGDEG